MQTLIVILLFLFHSCSSGEVDKCDKEIITFLPAVSVSTRSTMERGFEEGDKIAVAISGGKDSLLMAKMFQELKKHSCKVEIW